MDKNEAIENFAKMQTLQDRMSYASVIAYLFDSLKDMSRSLDVSVMNLRHWSAEYPFNKFKRNLIQQRGGPRRPKRPARSTEEKEQIVSLIAAYKVKGCALCNYSRSPRAIHFHHIEPANKSFALSKACNESLEDVKKEIEKCVVVCSNCHAEIHDGLIDLYSTLEKKHTFP